MTKIEGDGGDAALMRASFEAWHDRDAYAVSHVGFGMNPRARYEALAMYDKRDTNGTELRAVAGNFLFSTGANEFAGRFTSGHFDIPVMGRRSRSTTPWRCRMAVAGRVRVRRGKRTHRGALFPHVAALMRATSP